MRFIDAIFLISIIYRYMIFINKYHWKYEDKKCWFRVRFGSFLMKILLAHGITPKKLERCDEQMNITIGFSADNVIFKMGIIILASQIVISVFLQNTLCKTWKNITLIHIDRKYRFEYRWTNIDLSDIGNMDMQYYLWTYQWLSARLQHLIASWRYCSLALSHRYAR